MEQHGRDVPFEIGDLSGTVGWFTVLYPVCYSNINTEVTEKLIHTVKNMLFEAADDRFGYLPAYEKLLDEGERIPAPDYTFNYLGQIDSNSKRLNVDIESNRDLWNRDGRNRRIALIDFSGYLLDECLNLEFVYNKKFHEKTDIADMADQFRNNLCRIADHCIRSDSTGVTASDFGTSDLDDADLELILSQYR